MTDSTDWLTDAICHEFLRTGDFRMIIECEVGIYIASLTFPSHNKRYNALQAKTIVKAHEEYLKIQPLLDHLRGSPKADCPFEKDATAGEYIFIRKDYIGRHVISITRTSDRFFWTIGVRYEGDFWKQENNVKIIGYYSVGTNGNVSDLETALNATQHLFPIPEPIDPNYNELTTQQR